MGTFLPHPTSDVGIFENSSPFEPSHMKSLYISNMGWTTKERVTKNCHFRSQTNVHLFGLTLALGEATYSKSPVLRDRDKGVGVKDLVSWVS